MFFSIEDCYDLDISNRKLIQDHFTLLTCEQSFSKVLVIVGQGEKMYGSTLNFKEMSYDLQLRPRNLIQGHCTLKTHKHSLCEAWIKKGKEDRIYGLDKVL